MAAGAVPGPWNRLTVTMTALFALSSLTLGWSLLRPEPMGAWPSSNSKENRATGSGVTSLASPKSIELCHRLGLDYVSCSPYRVPVARLAAAQVALRYPATEPAGEVREAVGAAS